MDLRRLLTVLLLLATLSFVLSPLVRAATYPVTQEWSVTGSTTGVSGAQTEDGVFETLTEADAAVDPTTYPSTQVITTGTQVAGIFPTAIQASDNSYMQYREAPTGGSLTVSNNPAAVGTCSFTTGDNGRLSDNLYAASAGAADSCIYVTFGFSIPSGSSITKVELGYEAYAPVDDRMNNFVSWDGGTNWCPGQQASLPTTDPNAYTYQDFTNCGSHNWVPSDINNIASRFDHRKFGSMVDTIYLDANVIRVTYTPPGNYQLEVRYSWSAVPAGQTYTLSVEGHIQDEDVLVQVLTPPATWNTRLTLNSATDQVLTYVLTGTEYNAGGPTVRFVDALGGDAVQSDLWLDEVKITTTVIDYRLDIRQNVTGITGVSPVLHIKGRIPSGGENFNVYAWNFTAGAWDLQLSSVFTSTNAFHNVTLSSQYLSGGVVQVRFVDVTASDTIQDSLSLDFVMVSTAAGNASPGLSNDGVAPTTGNISTTFTFFVRYTDVDNDAPQYVRLQLNAVLYAMVENNSADTIYSDGKDYHYTLVIGTRGTFNYNFTTQAVTGDTSIVTSPTRQVSVLNRPPVVTNPIGADSVRPGRMYTRAFSGSDLDGDVLSWSLATNASFLAIGTSNGTVWGLAPVALGIYFVNVTVADGRGGTAFVNYSLSIVNSPPTITNPIASDAIHAGRWYTRDFNATDADGDTLTWSLVSAPPWVSVGSNNGTLYGRAPGVTASLYVNVSVTDGFGGQSYVNYTLFVTNAAPSITNPITSDTAFRASPYSRSFTATDPDGDILMWGMVTNAPFLSIGPSNGTVYGSSSSPPALFYVNVSAADGHGGFAHVNYSLLLVNRGPVITNSLSSQGYHGSFYLRKFNASDPEGDVLTWTILTDATWLSVGASNGTVWGTRPAGNYTYYVNVTVRDPYGASAFDNFTLSVGNIAPVLSPKGGDLVHSGAFYTRVLQGTDGDGDPLTWSVVTNASWVRIGPSNGTLYGRAPGVTASFYVNFSVDDGWGGRASRNFTVTLYNNPPVITGGVVNIMVPRTGFTHSVTGSDPDGDTLTWSLTTNATFLTIGSSTGTMTAVGALPGAYVVRVMVADGLGGLASAQFTLTFLNQAPTISGVPPTTAVAGNPYAATFTASDPEGDPLTWALASNAPWLSLDTAGHLSGEAVAGTFYVHVSVADSYGGVAYDNYTLAVNPPSVPFGLGAFFPWILPIGIAAGVGLGVAVALKKRRGKGDIVLRAFLFTDKAVLLQEFTSEKESPPVKLSAILKQLPRDQFAGDHMLDFPPYAVAVVQEGSLHLAVVGKAKHRASLAVEGRKRLLDLLGAEEIFSEAGPQGQGPS